MSTLHNQVAEIRTTLSDSGAPLGRYYTVGGRRLLLHRSGSGSPTVVFLPGAGAVGMDYLIVHERAAQLTTSVLYDRAGTGWSDPIGLPRTLAEVTDELHELFHAADVPAPYLMVGHSLGGLYARHYAQRFPDEVAGLLLLDPAHEDWDAYMPRQLNEMRKAYKLYQILNLVIAGALRFYDGPVKSDTETGRLKVYNYGHAQTIFRGLQGPSRARTPQGGEDRQSARRRTRRTPDAITRLEEAGPRRLAESL
jgi:pimeloyl-ACP methyl ester carboxylesterase